MIDQLFYIIDLHFEFPENFRFLRKNKDMIFIYINYYRNEHYSNTSLSNA